MVIQQSSAPWTFLKCISLPLNSVFQFPFQSAAVAAAKFSCSRLRNAVYAEQKCLAIKPGRSGLVGKVLLTLKTL
jgi:hypothetical protein